MSDSNSTSAILGSAMKGPISESLLSTAIKSSKKSSWSGTPLEYVKLNYEQIDQEQPSVRSEKAPRFDPHIPARLDNPLIPYPTEVSRIFNLCDNSVIDKFHDNHYSSLLGLQTAWWESSHFDTLGFKKMSQKIELLKRFATVPYSTRSQQHLKASFQAAKTMSEIDLKVLSGGSDIPLNLGSMDNSGLTFSLMIQRIRPMIAMGRSVKSENRSEASIDRISIGEYAVYADSEEYEYCIYVVGQNFIIAHNQVAEAFVGPTTYLDYLFSISDV